jgi:bacillithiol system protein YtxJ
MRLRRVVPARSDKHRVSAKEKAPLRDYAVLSTDPALRAALAESFARPLVLLKHSVWCGLSVRAIEAARSQIDNWAERIGCRVVVVQNHRDISDAIAHRLGIRHRPQIHLIRNGRAIGMHRMQT